MKKYVCLFMAIVLTVTMLSGCAGQEARPSGDSAPQRSAQNGGASTGEK